MSTLSHRQHQRLSDTYKPETLSTRPGLKTLQSWMENDPPLPETAPSWQPAYQAFHKDTRTNVAALTVSSAANRMTALGFRTGASGDRDGDDVAARVWAENQMAVEQVDILTDMLGLRSGYAMVGPPPKGEQTPIITAEDPLSVITAHDPARRQIIRAAGKSLHDPDSGEDEYWVYLPADPRFGGNGRRATAWRARKDSRRNQSWGITNTRYLANVWTWDDPIELPTTRVPFARFENRRGVAEYEPHLTILGRINRITLQRMLIAEIQAFRQRAIKGLPEVFPEGHPLAGQKIDYEGIFTPGPGSLWQVPEGVDFWESQPIDLRPLLDEERMEYRTLSALIGIPVSYFNPDDTNGSAEGASLQRETLVYRVEDRQTIAEASFNQVMSIAFEMMGDTQRAELSRIETIWAPIERLSLTERYQAAVQARAAGMAVATIRREVLKLTPRQMQAAADDDLDDLIMGRTAPQTTPTEAATLTQRPPVPDTRPQSVPRETPAA
jgi:hypothetical protein